MATVLDLVVSGFAPGPGEDNNYLTLEEMEKFAKKLKNMRLTYDHAHPAHEGYKGEHVTVGRIREAFVENGVLQVSAVLDEGNVGENVLKAIQDKFLAGCSLGIAHKVVTYKGGKTAVERDVVECSITPHCEYDAAKSISVRTTDIPDWSPHEEKEGEDDMSVDSLLGTETFISASSGKRDDVTDRKSKEILKTLLHKKEAREESVCHSDMCKDKSPKRKEAPVMSEQDIDAQIAALTAKRDEMNKEKKGHSPMQPVVVHNHFSYPEAPPSQAPAKFTQRKPSRQLGGGVPQQDPDEGMDEDESEEVVPPPQRKKQPKRTRRDVEIQEKAAEAESKDTSFDERVKNLEATIASLVGKLSAPPAEKEKAPEPAAPVVPPPVAATPPPVAATPPPVAATPAVAATGNPDVKPIDEAEMLSEMAVLEKLMQASENGDPEILNKVNGLRQEFKTLSDTLTKNRNLLIDEQTDQNGDAKKIEALREDNLKNAMRSKEIARELGTTAMDFISRVTAMQQKTIPESMKQKLTRLGESNSPVTMNQIDDVVDTTWIMSASSGIGANSFQAISKKVRDMRRESEIREEKLREAQEMNKRMMDQSGATRDVERADRSAKGRKVSNGLDTKRVDNGTPASGEVDKYTGKKKEELSIEQQTGLPFKFILNPDPVDAVGVVSNGKFRQALRVPTKKGELDREISMFEKHGLHRSGDIEQLNLIREMIGHQRAAGTDMRVPESILSDRAMANIRPPRGSTLELIDSIGMSFFKLGN